MTTGLEGTVALVTGAARGQGRAHAVRLAEAGADIVAVDICADIPTVGYPLATPDDLAETARLVEETGRQVLARQADVGDRAALDAVVAEGVAALGPVRTVIANAGVAPLMGGADEDDTFADVVGVNLVGAWNTVKAAAPSMITNDVMQAHLRATPATADRQGNLLPVPMVECSDIAEAVARLASDGGRYVTGATLPVDAGFAAK